MIEIIWQHDPTQPDEAKSIATATEAQQQLETGNRAFVDLLKREGPLTQRTIRLSGSDLGMGAKPGQAPAQTPFAAVLSCADARVPSELIFGQATNEIFVVRVAGNILGDVCVGSLQ